MKCGCDDTSMGFSINIAIISMLLAIVSNVPLCQATSTNCDYSRYKPLVYDHALLNAALEKAETRYPAAHERDGTRRWIEAVIIRLICAIPDELQVSS